MAVRLQR